MQTKTIRLLALVSLMQIVFAGSSWQAQAQAEKSLYPAMADWRQYLMPDEGSEVALARSAAPASIADQAEVLVLGRGGYRTAVKGGNGFVCLVLRGFGGPTDFPEFWNPKVRGPACVNPAAARTFLPSVQLRAKLAMEGRSKTEIAQAVKAAVDRGELPAPEPGAMCYMMSKQQYFGNQGGRWHPHLMMFVPGDAAKSWGADLPGSPVMAANDPEAGMTILMLWVGHWSDGTSPLSNEVSV